MLLERGKRTQQEVKGCFTPLVRMSATTLEVKDYLGVNLFQVLAHFRDESTSRSVLDASVVSTLAGFSSPLPES